MLSVRPRVYTSGSRWAAAVAGLAAVVVLPAAVLGVAGQHTTLASFLKSVRGDTLLENFDGSDSGAILSLSISGSGFSYTLAADNLAPLVRTTTGVGVVLPSSSLQFTFTGRPVTGFGGTYGVQELPNSAIAGVVSITTDTGESFVVDVPVEGKFFGFTTMQPFTTVTIQSDPPGGFIREMIDSVYTGTSVTAVELSDQCGDAPTVGPSTAAEYPFTTVGATAEVITGVCATGGVGGDAGPDVWVRFVSPVDGDVAVSTCGCNFDSFLRVFESCPVGGSGPGQIA